MEAQLINIPLKDIDFGDRYRKDYGDLESLANEIKEVGLIHPVTVVDKQIADSEYSGVTTNENRYLLVAGGRRFSAYTEHEIASEIPAYVYPRQLSEYELRKIELMENMSRKNLTWQEEAKMTQEIHSLEQKIKGKSITSSSGGHGLKETAEMLGKSKSTVKNEVDLAKAIEHIPELADIKNKTEALKLMRQMKKSHVATTKAQRVKQEISTKGLDGIKKDVINSFVHGNFFEHAEKLPENTFDLIEIDPPYGIDLGNVKKNSKHTTTNYNEIPAQEYKDFLKRTMLYAKKLLKPNGWLVCWYAISPWHSVLVETMQEVGFKSNYLPAMWIKPAGQTMRPKHYFASCYEPFIYARLGESASLNKAGSQNYLVHPPVKPDEKFHPTQRPVSLMEDLIERFIPDGKILVPFAGSGVTLRAAHNLGMKAIGYDLSQDAKNKHDAYVGEHNMEEPFDL